jgi:triacylglycerol esterase/lipase EstA (alpha/beta hydrolase family)
MKKPTFYALFIGINAYENCRQLNGCINDVLAVSRYFERLCNQQNLDSQNDSKIEWKPKFLLLPHAEEMAALEERKISFTEPSRKNIISAFDFFKDADPEAGDYCLLYYSGHGSFIDAPAVFSEVSPEGTLQTLVCSDSRSEGGRDLLDKELAYLIAKTLEGKTEVAHAPGVHFLSIFDSCHSGSVSRNDAPITARMEKKGQSITRSSQILGFTKTGNIFYKPFKEGQKEVGKDGLKHGRYINLSACRDAEVAQEKILDSYIEENLEKKRNHGVFSFSLLRTLERSGTDISYGALMRRVQMEVRARVNNQIPVLGKTDLQDDDLQFLRNNMKNPAETFEIGCREVFDGMEWYLNAGAINGIVPSNNQGKATVQLTDGSQRIVEVLLVKGMESILDKSAFTKEDEAKNLEAIIHEMPFAQVGVAYDAQIDKATQKEMDGRFAQNAFKYIRKAAAGESPTYIVKTIPDNKTNLAYILTRPGSDMPVFMRNANAVNLLLDAEKVGKWENTLLLANQETQIPRSDIQVNCQVLEGVNYAGVYQIPEQSYERGKAFKTAKFSEPILDPNELALNYKKINGEYVAPALSVEISNQSAFQDYWIGALYLDSTFGITKDNLEVQTIKANRQQISELEFRSGAIRLPFIPISLDPFYHEYGVSEITDYLVLVVAKKEFSLDNFEQAPLPLDSKRAQGGLVPPMKEDDWFTIKIPIHIRYPIDAVKVKAKEEKHITRTFAGHFPYNQTPLKSVSLSIEAPEGFGATVTATTNARAKRVVKKLSESRSTVNQKSLVPPAHLFNGLEGSEGVFSRAIAAEPDQQLSILELTEVQGDISEQRPLKIKPGDPLQRDETILPYGYDADNDLYFPLGYTDDDGNILIQQLPEATAEIIGSDAVDEPVDSEGRSLKKSIKLFFNKLVWSKLTGVHEYQTLALVQPKGETYEKIDYHGTDASDDRTALKAMKAQIKNQQKTSGKQGVLLLVHGIIGNTDAQVDAVFKLTKIHESFGAVLTFDYENLDTPIEKTAKHLAKSLKDLGLEENQLTIVAHSMGGLVTRYVIEREGGHKFVKKLIQAGTPNAGSELSDFRKKITGWIGLGINGISFVQPYMTVLSFIGKGLEKHLFKTLDQMKPGSTFLSELQSADLSKDQLPGYGLIAGNTTFIKAPLVKSDPVWKKIFKALKKRGVYLFLDYLVFNDDPNDMAVKVTSMRVLPKDQVDIQEIDCNHLTYFTNEGSLVLLEKMVLET